MLASCSYSGALPASWSAFANLNSLDLSINAISGSLPDSWSLLTALTLLDLSANALRSTIPVSYDNLATNMRRQVALGHWRLTACELAIWVIGVFHLLGNAWTLVPDAMASSLFTLGITAIPHLYSCDPAGWC